MSVCVLGWAEAGPSGIHLLKSVTLGGDTFWDYVTVDAARHRVFIAHGTHYVVVDGRTGEAIGDIMRERNIELATLDPVARGGFTQVPNFILKDGNIGLGANPRVADIGQMVDLGPRLDLRLLYLAEIADLGTFTQIRARAQARERSDFAAARAIWAAAVVDCS